MRDGLRIFLGALVFVLVLGSLVHYCAGVASAQETVYADKVAVGTPYPTPTVSPLTVTGLPTGQSGAILRAGTAGLIGTGPLVIGDIPGIFTQSDANETITGAWTFTQPIGLGTALGAPTYLTRSPGTRLVYFPAIGPASQFDAAVGVNSGELWQTLPSQTNHRFTWYAGGQTASGLVAELTGDRAWLPGLSYSGTLGLPNRKWLSLSAGELMVETLVLQDTLASTNGRQVIGVSASTLTRDLAPTDIYFHVKEPFAIAGDLVLMETGGKVEWFATVSPGFDCRVSCTDAPGPDYRYFVTRALDGTPANQYYAGDALLNTGQKDDGFIDLYAQRSTAGNGYPGYVLSDRPIAYYRMTGTAGMAGAGTNGAGDVSMLDFSGNNRAGSVTNWGGTFWGRLAWDGLGTLGTDLGFYNGTTSGYNGTAGVIVPPGTFPDLTGNLTVSFLAKRDGATDSSFVAFLGWTEFVLYVNNTTGALRVAYNGQDVGLGCALPLNVTTAVTVTKDDQTNYVQCFLNGAYVSQVQQTVDAVADATTGLWLGGLGSPGTYFRGYLDEVAIYDYVLPAHRIAAQYARRLSNSTNLTTANTAGPSVAVMIRQSPTYNDIRPRAILGNLLGDYGFASTTFGIALGDPDAANLIATGTRFAFRNQTVETLVIQGDSFAMGNPAPTGLDSGIGLWFNYNDGYPTFRVGNPDGSLLRWDGTSLLVREAGLTIDTAGLSLAASEPMVLDPPPTSGFAPTGRSIRFLSGATLTASIAFLSDVTPANVGTLAINTIGNRVSIGFLDATPTGLGLSIARTGAWGPAVSPYRDATMNLGALDYRWSNIFLNLPAAGPTPAYVVVQGPNNQDLAYVAPVVNQVINSWSSTTNAACLMTFRAGILTSTTCPP